MYQELNSCWLYACIISDTMFCWRRNPREHMDNAYPYVFRLPWLCVPVSFCTDIMQAYHFLISDSDSDFMSNSLVFCLSDEAQLVHLGWCDATLLTFDNSQISPVDQKCSIFCIAYLLKAFMSNLAESSFFDKWWSHFGISLLLSNIIRGTNVTLIWPQDDFTSASAQFRINFNWPTHTVVSKSVWPLLDLLVFCIFVTHNVSDHQTYFDKISYNDDFID